MQHAEDSAEFSLVEKDGQFSATHWSIVLAVGATDLSRATAALELDDEIRQLFAAIGS